MRCGCVRTAGGRLLFILTAHAPKETQFQKGRVESVGEAGRGCRMTRLEQRGAVAFTSMGVAVMVILLITWFGHLF